MSAEDPFSMMDATRSNSALSDYLNSLGRLEDPSKYRKESAEREDFNNKLLAGTGTVAAPFALAGIEGLKEDALKPALRKLAGRTGIKLTEEGGVDARGTISNALSKLNPRARLETLRRIRAGDTGYTDEGMEDPVQRVVRNPGDAPDLVDLPAGATRGMINPQDFIQGFYEGQRVLDQRISNSGDLPTRPLSDHDIAGHYELNAPDLEVSEARIAGHNLGQDVRNAQYKQLRDQWRRNQPEAMDDETEPAPGAAPAAEPEPTPPPLADQPGRRGDLSRMADKIKNDAADSITEDSTDGAKMMAQRAAIKAERVQRILAGEPTDDLPPDENWTPGSQLPTHLDASDREDDFGDGVEDAKNGVFNDPSEGFDDASLGADYREGHAAQTRMNQLDDIQKVAEHGLGDDDARAPAEVPANGGGATIGGAAEGEAGEVARTVAPKAAGAGADIGDELAENAGKAAATAATTDAELGGPEDIFGDLVALGAGLGTLFGGLGGEKKAPTPVLRTPVNPASEYGL